jgi:lipoprotein-anchoring transpeptidase ErfK/SrfK
VRALAVVLAALALAGIAEAAPPVVTAAATPAAGIAPLQVVLSAGGDTATHRWDLGDGAGADGAQVAHVYARGRFLATVTATGPTGETAHAQLLAVARRQTLSLGGPRLAEYGTPAVLTGVLRPARRADVRIYRGTTYVTSVRTGAGGRFRARILLREPRRYEARLGAVRSLYFLRGFAIHGYPSVPAYPASHGCVRVPMWIAPSLFARHGYGTTIVVYA